MTPIYVRNGLPALVARNGPSAANRFEATKRGGSEAISVGIGLREPSAPGYRNANPANEVHAC